MLPPAPVVGTACTGRPSRPIRCATRLVRLCKPTTFPACHDANSSPSRGWPPTSAFPPSFSFELQGLVLQGLQWRGRHRHQPPSWHQRQQRRRERQLHRGELCVCVCFIAYSCRFVSTGGLASQPPRRQAPGCSCLPAGGALPTPARAPCSGHSPTPAHPLPPTQFASTFECDTAGGFSWVQLDGSLATMIGDGSGGAALGFSAAGSR